MTEIQFSDVTFRYRRRDAPVLDGLDLAVPAGRTILLGPNGAGKSTILGLAASVLRAGRGRVTVAGSEARGRRSTAAYRRRVSYMPQTVSAAAGLTTREQVALHGWLAGMSRSDAWSHAPNALARVGLQHLEDKPATTLSGGQRARMGLAQALVHSADVLLLDEPAAPLDPDQREVFARLLDEVSHQRTVVVSSHDVADLEKTYDRVVVVSDGRVAFSGETPDFLGLGGEAHDPVTAYRSAVGAA